MTLKGDTTRRLGGCHVEKYKRYNIGQEEGVAFEPGSDITTAVFIFECGAFGGGGLMGWGPAGRLAAAEARCDNGLSQECGSRT